jgi:hypothetical protein
MKTSTVLARVSIGWSTSFVVEATLETLSALRGAKIVERGYHNDREYQYPIEDRAIIIEIIDSVPSMTAEDYRTLRDADTENA